jgi:hypothetical protein
MLALVLSVGLWAVARTAVVAEPPSPTPGEPVVIRLYYGDRARLNEVAGKLDVWEVQREAGYALAAVSPAEYQWLQDLGYRLEIDQDATRSIGLQEPLDPRFYYFDEGYANPNGLYVVDFLQQVAAAYAGLTELYDIGNAWQADNGDYHRDIWVLRLTNEDPMYGDIASKPVFYLFANIHAREVATPELAIRYIKYLTAGYGGEGGYGLDPDVTWLMDHNVAYVLVMQNPDGHRVNEEGTNANRRKNMDSDDGCTSPNSWGVDLNRNHSFKWGCCGGSSSDPCGITYRGPQAASEPETQAFQTHFASVMRDQNGPNGDDELPPAAPITTTGIFVSLHQYGDLVIWPYGFDTAPNDADLKAIGRKFAYYNGYDPAGFLYTVDGATDDWTYGKFGVASYTFEIGSGRECGGFFADYGCIDGVDGKSRSFWDENKPAFLYAHKIARTPYMTVYGPDSEDLAVAPHVVPAGTAVELAAVVADRRYLTDTLHPVAAAEYFVDAPGQDGSGTPLSPSDGAWGGEVEPVTATVDTTGWMPGRHYLLVHGRNESGDWGPFSAVFVYTGKPGVSLPQIEGYVRDAVTEVSLEATVTANNSFQTSSDATTGYYSLTVISDTYDLSAVAASYAISTVMGIEALDGQTMQQDFHLLRMAPNAQFTSNSPVLLGQPTIFTNTTIGEPPFRFRWDMGDGLGMSSERDPIYTYGSTGWFTVTLVVTDVNGQDSTRHPVSVLTGIYLPVVLRNG